MRRRLSLLLGLITPMVLSAQIAVAKPEIEMIVSRSDKAVEIYFAMPTTVAVDTFGIQPDELTDDRGFADFDRFSAGTYDLATTFVERLNGSIDGTELDFDAMSLMIHPASESLPYRDPIDAVTTIEVCGYERDDVLLKDTRLFVGMIAYTDQTSGALSVSFLDAINETSGLKLKDFTNFELRNSASFLPGDLESLTLVSLDQKKEMSNQDMLVAAGLLAILACFVAPVVRSGRLPKPRRLSRH